ncbi:MAG: glycosyltransferase family A protein [Microbacter sp.]
MDGQYHRNIHKGASAARNVGINKSTGKYILFLDSDDYLLSYSALTDLNKS